MHFATFYVFLQEQGDNGDCERTTRPPCLSRSRALVPMLTILASHGILLQKNIDRNVLYLLDLQWCWLSALSEGFDDA